MGARNGVKARAEVLDMLKHDHERVKKAFSAFDKLRTDERERCAVIVERTCAELEVHAALEEELFYPAIRASLADPSLVDQAEVEHRALKMLILELDRLEPGEEKHAASFKVLGEYTRHHAREEEKGIFEQLARVKVDWEALLQDMQQRRIELMEEIGLEVAELHGDAPEEKNNRAMRALTELED